MGLIIITGAYGSGKTECVLALALEAALRGGRARLVDVDFVTPYFRAQDYRRALEALGVEVIAPPARVAPGDGPSFPPEAVEALIAPRGETYVDLGGDPQGAIVLAQIEARMPEREVWGVVNFSRPQTENAEAALKVLQEISACTGLEVTGLIANTHMGHLTTPADIHAGLAEAQRLGEMMGIPVLRVGVPKGLEVGEVGVEALRLSLRVKRPWERDA